MEDGLLKLSGGQLPTPDKFIQLATVRFIGGFQTQRSPFQSVDISRYAAKYLGGKPDALIAGHDCEISNKLILQRRPGLIPYGVSNIPSPDDFYDWELGTTGDIILVVDTQYSGGDNFVGANGGILRYSPTNSGVYVNKSAESGQTNFFDVVNTLYMGDGEDLYKIVGPNLLTWSNQFGTGAGTIFTVQAPWTENGIFSLTPGQTDPLGGTNATQIIWSTTGSSVFLKQSVLPNYTPTAYNTFTFSIWMEQTGGAESVTITLGDENGTIASQVCVLTSSWVKYSVTATLKQNSTAVVVSITNPTATSAINLYGAQLEVGGPATTTQITTTKPQGVWLWGIAGPTTAPTFTTASQTGNTGKPWQPNHLYHVGDTIVDSNGNLEYATNSGTFPGTVGANAGTSGGSQPTWNTQTGGLTPDGIQGSVVQGRNASASGASSLTFTLTSAVTAGDALVLVTFVSNQTDSESSSSNPTISDTQSNSYVHQAHLSDFTYYCDAWLVASANAGTTTVTITLTAGSSRAIFAQIVELSSISGTDGSAASNVATNASTPFFTTGGVTTTNAQDMIVSAFIGAAGGNTGSGADIGNPPSGYVAGVSSQNLQTTDVNGNPVYVNQTIAITLVSSVGFYNPDWSVTNPINSSALFGFTIPLKSTVGSLQWYNLGQTGAGLTAGIGYEYYYAFGNSYTGHFSNVSPISASTGPITGQIVTVTGATRTMTPGPTSITPAQWAARTPWATDPQSDLVAVYRNTNGGAFWYQLALFGNGAAAQASLVAANYPGLTTTGVSYGSGTWSYSDTTPDTGLNTSIFAPIALLNSLPPVGLIDMEFFAGRMWASVENDLFYNTSTDNTAELGIGQNGVPAESWFPDNFEPFNAPVTRIVAIGGGLLTCTTLDTWLVTGQNLLTGGFNQSKILANHGLRSYNLLSYDGSNLYMYTSDNQCLCLNPNSGSIEIGFVIGDYLEANFPSTQGYMARHVSGSQDNALYFSNGSQWLRLNPNQAGASLSGEQTPVWSPPALFSNTIGGLGAIASIETSAGVIQLLVGLPHLTTSGIPQAGPVLTRSLTTFSDNSIQYNWSATIGSMLLAMAGELAWAESITTEMNNILNAATQVGVAVLLNEISGNFESLPLDVNDPPQLVPSVTVLSNRFYLSQGKNSPMCRHIQIQLNGATATTKDEFLALTVRGARELEQG